LVSRVLTAVGVAAMTAAFGLFVPPNSDADPTTCPPNCDRIPATAWIDPTRIPLYGKYSWPDLAGVAVPQQRPRFKFEKLCSTLPALDDPRAYVVAARANAANPPGQWQLQVQVLHWRGETWRGGQLADNVVSTAATALRACQVTAPQVSPSLTTDQPGQLAAVLSIGGESPAVLHQYLVAHPQSSTLVELAMWASSPPAESWPLIPDDQIFDALITPLCATYLSSCR
jgi:hypothetical protein